jgi:UDP-glucose 4-epimerase
MKILITGAYGFLGRYTAKAFKDAGHHITGIGHGKWHEDEYLRWGIDTWVESTITFESLINTNLIFDIIIHCGGSGAVGFSHANPYEDFQKSVQSTLSLLEYIRLRCPECKFIYPSSVAVQGSQPDVAINEEMVAKPVSPYGYHKKIAEELCESYHQNYGLNVGIIRFFSIYGNGLQKQLLFDACKKIDHAQGKEITFFGTGEETRDWIHVTDASKLIYKFSQKFQGMDIINGGSGQRVEIREVLNLLVKEFGVDITVNFNGAAREGDPRFFWSDMAKAKKYDYATAMNLEEGIRSFVKSYKELKK